jgi:hypothetical protein
MTTKGERGGGGWMKGGGGETTERNDAVVTTVHEDVAPRKAKPTFFGAQTGLRFRATFASYLLLTIKTEALMEELMAMPTNDAGTGNFDLCRDKGFNRPRRPHERFGRGLCTSYATTAGIDDDAND